MKIKEVIEALQEIEQHEGDVDILIDVLSVNEEGDNMEYYQVDIEEIDFNECQKFAYIKLKEPYYIPQEL